MKSPFCPAIAQRFGIGIFVLLAGVAGVHAQAPKPPEAPAPAPVPAAPVAPAPGPKSKPPEISFTVKKLDVENVEGPDVVRSYFPAGDRKIVFGKPPGVRFSGDDAHLLILLTDLGLDGEIHVNRSTFGSDFDLAANALQYREAGAKSMPEGAEGVTVLPPTMNPFPYNGWKSLGFTWTYNNASGQAMIRTVNYINLEIGTQIVVTTLATKKDAQAVAKLAKQFIASWWVMGK